MAEKIPSATEELTEAELDRKKRALAKNLPRGMYEDVSTEHVLRRATEALVVAGLPADAIRLVLERIGPNFDFFLSSVSAEFRQRSQAASMVIGIALALALNINAYRLLDTFVRTPGSVSSGRRRRRKRQENDSG